MGGGDIGANYQFRNAIGDIYDFFDDEDTFGYRNLDPLNTGKLISNFSNIQYFDIYVTTHGSDSWTKFHIDDLDLSSLGADTTNPSLMTSTPADNATAFAGGSDIVLTFSEAVDVETGNITIKKLADDSTVEAIDVTSGLVTGTGSTQITINPTADLAGLTAYYLNIDATAFDDAAGNSYGGLSDSTTLNFATEADTTAPTLISSTPADEATDIAVDSDIVLTFSENVDIESGTIDIKMGSHLIESIDVTGDQVTGTGTTQITINPTADLTNNSTIYLIIDGDAFDDAAGNSYAGISADTILNFQIETDTTAPTLSSSTPADNATAVAVDSNIVLTFSERVTATAMVAVVEAKRMWLGLTPCWAPKAGGSLGNLRVITVARLREEGNS